MKAVVVSFDHLPVGFLGCYGNTWVDTPNFDRLAAEAVVFDGHFAECLGSTANHAWWTGCRQFPAAPGTSRGGDVVDQLRGAGVRTKLLVEEPNARPVPTPTTFDEVATIEGVDGLDADPPSTPFARLVAEASRRMAEDSNGNELLWLKSRGVPSPWSPPREFAERYVALFEDLEDETEDVPGPSDDDEFEWVAIEDTFEDDETEDGFDEAEVEPADEFEDVDEDAAEGEELDEQEELDALLRALAGVGEHENTDALDTSDWLLVRAVYGGYVALLDLGIGELRKAIAEQWGDDVLLIVTAVEGESLGERVGFPAGPAELGEECVHTPLIVSAPGMLPGMRCHDLTQPMDVAASLLDWFGITAADAACEGRSLLPAVRGERIGIEEDEYAIVYGNRPSTSDVPPAAAIRTRHRVLTTSDATRVQEADPRDDEVQLFVKPSDVWEMHDVSSQSPDETRAMAAKLAEFLALAQSACPVAPPRLD